MGSDEARKVDPLKFKLRIDLTFPKNSKAEGTIFLDPDETQPLKWTAELALVYGAKLLSFGRIPRKLNHHLVYVVADNCEYVVFDALKTAKDDNEEPTAVLPAMFDVIKANSGSDRIRTLRGQLSDVIARQISEIAEEISALEKQESGLAETKKRISALEEHKSKKEVPAAAEFAGWLEHSITIVRLEIGRDGNKKMVCEDDVTWRRYPLGEYARLLPTPALSKADEKPEQGAVIGKLDLSSDEPARFLCCEAVWDPLSKLSGILETGKSLTILIQGPPGSGKEVFSNALHYGALRPKGGEFVRRSLGGATLEDARITLLGAVTERGTEIPGLIAKARGGTLFIDEFDKAQNLGQLGALLLRILEAKEYRPEGGQQTREVDDVNWIFAGAFQDENSAIGGPQGPPRDLQSRLSGCLELKNALEEPGYPAAQFFYWHMVEVIAWLGKERWYDALVKGEGDFKVRLARRALAAGDPHPAVLQPGKQIIKFAKEFETIVRKIERGDRSVSIRSIRQTSGCLTHYVLEQFLKDDMATIDSLRKGLATRAHDALLAASAPKESPKKWFRA